MGSAPKPVGAGAPLQRTRHTILPSLTLGVAKKNPACSSGARFRRKGCSLRTDATANAGGGGGGALRGKAWEVVVGFPLGASAEAFEMGRAAERDSVRTAFNVVACVNVVLTAVLFVHTKIGGVFDLARHPAGMANRAGTSIGPQIASALAIQGLGVWAVRSCGLGGHGEAVVLRLSWQPKSSTLVALYLLCLPAHFFVCVLHVPYFLYVLRYIVDFIQLLLALKHFSRAKYCWFPAPGSRVTNHQVRSR